MSRQDFIDQLNALGYVVEDRGEDRISFPYDVPVGTFLGKKIHLGFAVPSDFPATSPSGPHVSPRLLPLNNTSKEHPAGGIHESPFGPDWEYWSRPFPEWNKTSRTVKTYMAHIQKLFATQ